MLLLLFQKSISDVFIFITCIYLREKQTKMATRTSHCGHQHISELLNRSDKNLKMKALQTLDGSRRGTENSDDDVMCRSTCLSSFSKGLKLRANQRPETTSSSSEIQTIGGVSLWLPLLAVAVVSPHSTIVSHLFIPKTFILRNSVYSPFPNLYIQNQRKPPGDLPSPKKSIIALYII